MCAWACAVIFVCARERVCLCMALVFACACFCTCVAGVKYCCCAWKSHHDYGRIAYLPCCDISLRAAMRQLWHTEQLPSVRREMTSPAPMLTREECYILQSVFVTCTMLVPKEIHTRSQKCASCTLRLWDVHKTGSMRKHCRQPH
jgi:hypothetical protein